MRLSSISPGDIVRVSVRGRIFHAVVKGTVPEGLQVEPIEKNISHRHIKARDVLEHWAKRGRPRAETAADTDPAQASFDHLLDR